MHELPKIGRVLRNLVSLGAGITWVISTVAAHLFLGLDWALSTLLGAILIVSGPTVIGPLLRHVRPIGQVGPILRWEGIVIDPIGAMLAVLVFEAILIGELRHATTEFGIGAILTIVDRQRARPVWGVAPDLLLQTLLDSRFPTKPSHIDGADQYLLSLECAPRGSWPVCRDNHGHCLSQSEERFGPAYH